MAQRALFWCLTRMGTFSDLYPGQSGNASDTVTNIIKKLNTRNFKSTILIYMHELDRKAAMLKSKIKHIGKQK